MKKEKMILTDKESRIRYEYSKVKFFNRRTKGLLLEPGESFYPGKDFIVRKVIVQEREIDGYRKVIFK